MQLIPIQETLAENALFDNNPLCKESLHMTLVFYMGVGFRPPWISYYAKLNGELVGAAGFKGAPVNDTVEIAYGTFEPYQHQGIGKAICRKLVEIALKTDPSIRITARTLPEPSHSTKILQYNGFLFLGTVEDKDDGPVWEWEYQK
jgi:[ribosomal protein S5]-alanine N-acetyltransferase